MNESEHIFYRLTACHPKRITMDEIILGITEARELKKEWEEDEWEVTIEED